MPDKTEKPMDIVDIVNNTLLGRGEPYAFFAFEKSWADSDFHGLVDVKTLNVILDNVNRVLESPAIRDTHKVELRDYKEDLLSHLETLKK